MTNAAIIIGQSQHGSVEFKSLPGVDNDLADVHGFLRHTAHYQVVHLLRDLPKAEVLSVLSDVLGLLSAGDRLVIYFSGHGHGIGGEHVLVCHGATRSRLRWFHEAIPVNQLREMTDGFGLERSVLIDSCWDSLYAATDRGGPETMTPGQANYLRDVGTAPVQPTASGVAGSFALLCACSEDQVAVEVPALRRGLFTAAWMDVMSDAARGGRGVRMSSQLAVDVAGRMRALAAEHRLPIIPDPLYSGRGDPVLLEGTPRESGTAGGDRYADIASRVLAPSEIRRQIEQRERRAREVADRKAAEERELEARLAREKADAVQAAKELAERHAAQERERTARLARERAQAEQQARAATLLRLRYELGAAMEESQWDKAEEACGELLELDPANAEFVESLDFIRQRRMPRGEGERAQETTAARCVDLSPAKKSSLIFSSMQSGPRARLTALLGKVPWLVVVALSTPPIIYVCICLGLNRPSQRATAMPAPERKYDHITDGNVQFRAGEYAQAIREYTRALRIDPNDADILSCRAQAYCESGRNDLALQDYGKAIEKQPKNASLFCLRGAVHAALGHGHEAAQDFEQALANELDPADVYAASYRAAVRNIERCDIAIGTRPENAEMLDERGAAYGVLHQHARAIEDFDQALAIRPYFHFYFHRAEAYAALCRDDLAVLDYDKVIESEPNVALYYAERAKICARLGRNQQAICDVLQATVIDPDNVEALQLLRKFQAEQPDLVTRLKAQRPVAGFARLAATIAPTVRALIHSPEIKEPATTTAPATWPQTAHEGGLPNP